eukprot:Rmarinus@m.18841
MCLLTRSVTQCMGHAGCVLSNVFSSLAKTFVACANTRPLICICKHKKRKGKKNKVGNQPGKKKYRDYVSIYFSLSFSFLVIFFFTFLCASLRYFFSLCWQYGVCHVRPL